jgi:FkbM family methyltransferase
LVEALPELAGECVRNRPHATVVCGAVVSPTDSGRPIGIVDHDLMSHLGDCTTHAVGVTLSDLIDALCAGRVGLVVIDVEGMECAVLEGLDLDRHRPEYLLVESGEPDRVGDKLSGAYSLVAQLSHHDFLYRAQVPSLCAPGSSPTLVA